MGAVSRYHGPGHHTLLQVVVYVETIRMITFDLNALEGNSNKKFNLINGLQDKVQQIRSAQIIVSTYSIFSLIHLIFLVFSNISISLRIVLQL